MEKSTITHQHIQIFQYITLESRVCEKCSPIELSVPSPPVILNAVADWQSESTMLGCYHGWASWIPDELEGIVVTADLQGLVPHPLTKEPELMGLAVVGQLVDLYLDGPIPSPSRMTALLTRDFFALADGPGGFACVAENLFSPSFCQCTNRTKPIVPWGKTLAVEGKRLNT